MSAMHAERGADNRRLLWRLSVVAVVMFGFGYALIPFYKQICEAFGLNYFYQRDAAPANSQIDGTRSISVELDANTADVPWRFRPLTRHVSVHPGELFTVEYEVVNSSAVPVTGQAVASFGPQIAGRYFKKLECFCFKQQTLAPGESRRMPVVFVIDPGLPRDVGDITLSYTFFEVPGAGERS
ncbi:MAG: cytochrome c oxidase assembly protein [Sphingomonadaceae bacterium]|jgi:cytochrome c oxidase assembly protein subunit 11